jgi:dTDP-4-amino-4,6-dideoxygalactose transaminase
MPIKMVDLKAQYREIHQRVESDFAEIHANSSYIGGPAVAAFESEFARFLGVRRVVGVASGTDALRLALIAIGVGAGDEVVTTPMTFIATVEAIVQAGARPAFVDVDPISGNLSVPALKRYLASGNFASAYGPKVVLPVHLYGLPAPMTELLEVAEANGLKVLEDACQAHGARMNIGGKWIRMGSLGAAGCFSFYPGKNLGAWGEAGAVATNDDNLADEVLCLRDHGRVSHYAHSAYGYNARLDAVQAAVLRAKLERLDDWNARRRRLAALYSELLPSQGLQLPYEPEGLESCYHLFVIRSAHRDAIRTALLDRQIECGIHYPMPLHLQPACRELGYQKGDFPACESMAETVLSLPMHPHLTDREVELVAEVVRSAVAKL